MATSEISIATWNPAESLSYGDKCLLGRGRAKDLIANMIENDDSSALGHTVQAMLVSGQYDGLEIGFFQELGERLISA